MGLSLVAIPVFLDTNTEASHLLTQFVRLYHYGHRLMPSLAVATFLLYGFTSIKKHAAGEPWLIHLLAGVTTLTMVPFTWVTMVPTNNALFQLDEQSRTKVKVNMDRVQRLVTKWGVLHVVRSLFPLAGAILGGISVLQQLGF
jgi:hypothetical protein